MIHTLQRLRDIGNTVIVVEHDEETIRAADHIIEIGPGAQAGQVVAQGTVEAILCNTGSLTGQFLSERRSIPMPCQRRQAGTAWLHIRGAQQNNLRHIDVSIPIGLLVCVTGVSGSGKSTLVNDILYKSLQVALHDSRIIPGAHDSIEGIQFLHGIINIDQSPIGRTPSSNPATYVGIYDVVRALFARKEESKRRGYDAGRFSFNMKGGRCEECSGHGIHTSYTGDHPPT